MKKLIYISLILGGFVLNKAQAQYFPIHSHYLLNDFPWNPAIAGSKKLNPANINVRRQWTGIDDAPQSYSLSFHGLLFQHRMGMGGYIFGNTTGPTNVTGVQYTWAYHIPVRSGRSKISFGISGLAIQRVFDTRKLTLDVPIDPAINGEVLRSIFPEANAGLYYYSDFKTNPGKKYWFGISGTNLLQSDKRIGNKNTLLLGAVQRHYFTTGGVQIKIFKKVAIEPSFMLIAPQEAVDDVSLVQPEIAGRLIFNDSLWIGTSYKKDEAVTLLLGVQAGGLAIGYSYDFLQTGLKNYSPGSHEISVIFRFRRREMKML